MSDLFNLALTGRLGRDPELKQVGGQSVLECAVASGDYAKDGEKTYWTRVTLWGKRAESLSRLLTKGRLVAASGHLSVREYTGKDGQARTSLELRADQLEPLGPKPGAAPPAQAGQQGTASESYQGPEDDLPF